MKRPWHIGLIVLLCLAVVFAVMGWITVRLLRAEERNREMQRQAAEESITRLALWRMDAAVSPLIIAESARPYYEYAAFNPAETVYPIAYNRGDSKTTLVPSPLLTQSSSNVLAYFNGVVGGKNTPPRLVSPQVPTGRLNDWVLENTLATGIVAVNSANFDTFTANVTVAELRDAFGETGLVMNVGPDGAADLTDPLQRSEVVHPIPGQDQQQVAMSANEQAIRHRQTLRGQQRIQSTKQQMHDQNVEFYNTNLARGGKPAADRAGAPNERLGLWSTPAQKVDEGVMKATWIRDMLVLGRLVSIDDTRYVQGVWLNWDALRQELLAEVSDILPSARLSPVAPGSGEDKARIMATLPVRLAPGPCAALPPAPARSLNVPLITAWTCVLVAALAVSLLVAGTVSLSERRAAFVSAVTHELRTPLTTFQMYSEMLSEGMVPEDKKLHYFDVLRAEGNRLSHLVENVLSYSRLERGRHPCSFERLTLGGLIERIGDRLERRAAQAEMTLVRDCGEETADIHIKAELAAVEQVLFNLVDNACKYAAGAADRRIHLEVSVEKGGVTLSVRDHGPGIGKHEAKRLFHPFRKSAKHAAETAPGVGLGLALSRKLARRMGGTLRIKTAVTEGACFELVLPARNNTRCGGRVETGKADRLR